MPDPITMDIPHKHTRAEIRSRLDGGAQKVAAMVPGGSVVSHQWEGDTLLFTVAAMGQRVASRVAIFDDHVHAEIHLPLFLSLFAGTIRAKLAREAPKLLG